MPKLLVLSIGVLCLKDGIYGTFESLRLNSLKFDIKNAVQISEVQIHLVVVTQ